MFTRHSSRIQAPSNPRYTSSKLGTAREYTKIYVCGGSDPQSSKHTSLRHELTTSHLPQIHIQGSAHEKDTQPLSRPNLENAYKHMVQQLDAYLIGAAKNFTCFIMTKHFVGRCPNNMAVHTMENDSDIYIYINIEYQQSKQSSGVNSYISR